MQISERRRQLDNLIPWRTDAE
ncbi:protein of unknown function [Cupriavidus neocaledonicus]|uniref:Uncharacterized protein n=1 Tax=Cupriavidus neocaledonicus TaxID=1040979 RepID=A0A375H8W1_9BURK|nr:protein of unknown function [Cupriavidus neocaledonicus]